MGDYYKLSDGVNTVEIVGDKIVADIDGKTEVFGNDVDISEVFRYIDMVKRTNHLKKKVQKG